MEGKMRADKMRNQTDRQMNYQQGWLADNAIKSFL